MFVESSEYCHFEFIYERVGQQFNTLKCVIERWNIGVTRVHKIVMFSTNSVDNTVSKMFNRTARAMVQYDSSYWLKIEQ